jgi:REP element-mobilizing transposase RayT
MMGRSTNTEHYRRSIRLQGYDYSQVGAYFVTVCVQNRKCPLGDILKDEMRLNDAGRMVERWWVELGNKFPSFELDEYVVMPNHFHGIIIIVGADLCVRPIPEIVQWFKTMTTNEYIRSVKSLGWIPFNARLWQRNYYERVIRNEEEMCRIRQYIADNPAQWTHDRENPHMDGPVRPT